MRCNILMRLSHRLLGQEDKRAVRLHRWLSLASVALLSVPLALSGCVPGSASTSAKSLFPISQIVMLSPSDGWAVREGGSIGGIGGILHYSNGQWQLRDDSPPSFIEAGIAMLSAAEGWAFVDLDNSASRTWELWHFQANQWTRAAPAYHTIGTIGWSCGSDTVLTAIVASSPHDIWAVGDHGCIVHYDGTTWTLQTPVGDYDFDAIATLPDGEVWVGSTGQTSIWHYSAGTWTQVYNRLRGSTGIMSIMMVSGSEGWAGMNCDGTCGCCGGLLHYTGGLWSEWSSVFHPDARSIAMVSASEGWAVGSRGTIWHYDGNTWSVVASPTNIDLSTVAMASASEGWAGGGQWGGGETHSVLLHYTNGMWSVYQNS